MRFFAILSLFLWMPIISAAQDGDDDPGYLVSLLEESLSGSGHAVRIRGFEGALSSEASLRLLTISDDDGEWFRAERVVLDWNRLALLRGRVEVNKFTADNVIFTRFANSETETPKAEATPFEIPDLPVSVQIDEVAASSVVLGAPILGEAAEFTVTGDAQLIDGAADIHFNLDRIDGASARIELTAGYDPSSRQLSVDLNAQEDAGGIAARLLNIPNEPSLALTIQGDSPIDDYAANISLETDGQPRILGTVELLAPEGETAWNVTVDVTGDPTPLLTEDVQPFFGTSVGLKAQVNRQSSGRIELPEFALKAAKLSMNGSAALAENGWIEALNANGRIANPDGTPVILPFGGGETLVDAISFDAEINDSLTLDARIDNFENPTASLESLVLTGRGEVNPKSFSETGQLDLNLTWSAENLALTDPALAEAVGTSLNGAAQVDYTSGQPLLIRDLKANGDNYGLSGDATWTTDNNIPLAVQMRLAAQDITRFSALAGRELSGRVDVNIAGEVDPLSGMVDLVVDGTTVDLTVGQDVADRILTGIGSARIDVRRDETGTTLRNARVVTSAATIQATGKLDSERADVRFDGRLNDLERIFPGQADGSAELIGSVSFEGSNLTTAEISANLANQSGPVVLPIADGVTLDSGKVVVKATGGPTGSWSADVQALKVQSSVLSSSALDLNGEGDLRQAESGVLDALTGKLVATGSGLRVSDSRISRAVGTDPTTSMSFEWQQDSERLTVRQFSLETGSIDATGSALVTQALTAPDAQFSTVLVADSLAPLSDLAGQSLRGRATIDVNGTYKNSGDFNVTASGQGTELGINNAILDRLLSGVTNFEFNSTGQAGQLDRMSAEIKNPEITASVNGPMDRLNVDATLRDLALIAPDFPGSVTIGGTIEQRSNQYGVDVDLIGPGGAELRVGGVVTDGTNANLDIDGVVALGLANSFIEPRRLNGRAELDLSLNGPFALTSLSGTITPSKAELSAPTLGIILNPITGQIQLQSSAAQVGLVAQGNNGGSIDINGRLGLETFDASLTATLTRFGIRDVSLYDTSVDGTITFTGPIGRNLLVAGDLRLNETEIQVPSSGVSALSEIPNIEHLGATRPVMRSIERAGLVNDDESESSSGRSSTQLDLSLTAPGRVFVRGRGLDAELDGELKLTGPTSDIIPQGGFELIRGRLDILNQRFTLTEGRIQMSGSFDPVLYFVATTEANGIEVEIILDGPVSAPDISFSSSPELPEDEVLAQLLFGRNLSELSALQALELANAVATLAGGGAGGILSRLRDGFGLDDLDLARTDDGGTAVRAGKYISENVYSDVLVESGGRTELSINLDITSSLTARGSVDNQGNSSVGVFFERDY